MEDRPLHTVSAPRRRWPALLALASLLTLVNCIKPLHIDDTSFYDYAAQVARAPLDPYGFDIFWFQHPQPSIELPVPPVVPYYLAPAIRLFHQPALWKAWCFPLALLLVWSLDALMRRFAPRFAGPLLWMTVLSPTILPSFNLMLDLPALALCLASLVVFVRATDRYSAAWAVVAGVLAALAIQAKYTGLVAPAVILLYGVCFGHVRLALVAATTSGLLFVGSEALFALQYGQSHFLAALGQNESPLWHKFKLVTALFRIFGAAHAAGALLGLLALGVAPRRLVPLAVAIVLAYVALVALPEQASEIVANLSFGAVGAIALGSAALAATRLCGDQQLDPSQLLRSLRALTLPQQLDRDAWFLLAWFGLELVAYLVISPFTAVRRVLGVLVVATLIVGRLLGREHLALTRVRWLRAAAFGSMLSGGLYAVVDHYEAAAQRAAVAQAEAALASLRADSVWYVGHWGFQFYAEQAGWRAVVPDESRLAAGDWLVVPDLRVGQQMIDLQTPGLSQRETFEIADRLPLRTVANYYAGRRPLERHTGPRVAVSLYRVEHSFVAHSLEHPAQVADRRAAR